MTWALGVLAWNDPASCRRTITALAAGVSGEYTITVLDNGSVVPMALDPGVTISRQPKNLGAGGGLTALVSSLLHTGAEALLCVEDDWILETPLALAALEPLLIDPTVGQIRLGRRPAVPGTKYYTYGLSGADADAAARQVHAPVGEYLHGHYQRLRTLWSNNPFACTRAVARRFLLTGLDELRMARPYYAAGLQTISTTPGHFRHQGEIRDRRARSGWTK